MRIEQTVLTQRHQLSSVLRNHHTLWWLPMQWWGLDETAAACSSSCGPSSRSCHEVIRYSWKPTLQSAFVKAIHNPARAPRRRISARFVFTVGRSGP